mmetsp:Transcript_7385/g.13740  ORF Transcript_7385/g.13740 Transcript_7385/m.13740 type:complete len:139 (+) Transcript_7385:569-985(+)
MWRWFSRFVKIRSFNRDQSRNMMLPDKRLVPNEVYEQRAANQLQRLTQAFEKLRADNSAVVSIEGTKSGVKLSVQSEEFTIKTDPQRQTIWLTVPVEGAFEYYYDEGNERWIGWADGHMLEELLARSVLSKVQGYLDL